MRQVRALTCPACWVPPGVRCVDGAGRWAPDDHRERVAAYDRTYGDGPYSPAEFRALVRRQQAAYDTEQNERENAAELRRLEAALSG